jgi:hypothetical protein
VFWGMSLFLLTTSNLFQSRMMSFRSRITRPLRKSGWWAGNSYYDIAHAIPGIQDGDETSIFDASQALHTIQKLFGLFPRIIGKGDHAGVS